jgi:hypothetical protein
MLARVNDDKIIRFPSGDSAKAKSAKEPAKDAPREAKRSEGKPVASDGAAALDAAGLEALTADQRKAIGIVLSGMPFVLVGVKPTQSGADFFTAIGGDATDLRNASAHLPGVIERARSKRGI